MNQDDPDCWFCFLLFFPSLRVSLSAFLEFQHCWFRWLILLPWPVSFMVLIRSYECSEHLAILRRHIYIHYIIIYHHIPCFLESILWFSPAFPLAIAWRPDLSCHPRCFGILFPGRLSSRQQLSVPPTRYAGVQRHSCRSWPMRHAMVCVVRKCSLFRFFFLQGSICSCSISLGRQHLFQKVGRMTLIKMPNHKPP